MGACWDFFHAGLVRYETFPAKITIWTVSANETPHSAGDREVTTITLDIFVNHYTIPTHNILPQCNFRI
jgi:hypothetical protein